MDGILQAILNCLEQSEIDGDSGGGEGGEAGGGGGGGAGGRGRGQLDELVIATLRELAAAFRERFSSFNAHSQARRKQR